MLRLCDVVYFPDTLGMNECSCVQKKELCFLSVIMSEYEIITWYCAS